MSWAPCKKHQKGKQKGGQKTDTGKQRNLSDSTDKTFGDLNDKEGG